MALKTGRQGWVGLGVESTPGTPVAATTTVPYINNTLQGKHQPQTDISARANRLQQFTSVIGKQWGEGELDVNVDTLNVGFLLKLALGNENVNTIVSSQVFDHVFYATVSGNTPTTATLYVNKGVDTQQFASMTVDKLDLEIKDQFMVAKAGFKGFFPTTGSYTPVSVSGTLINFNDYQLQTGTSLISAAAASASALTEFTMSLKNNAENIFESGNSTSSRVFWKQFDVNGSFTRYFESATDRDNYLNLNKQSIIVTASGNALPGGNVEKITINLAKCAYTDQTIDTGLENFFAVKTTFQAEWDPNQAKQIDIILRNYRSTAYS